MLKGKLLGTSILKGKIQREVITISKEEQEVVIEPRTEQFDVYPDVGKVIKKATVKAVTSDIDENIIARNIRGGVTILGVTGDLEPDKPDQSKVVEPSTSEQVITADSGYELESVTIKPVTAEIDSDIVAENIRKDTEILGVMGTMEAREDLDTELAEQETLIAELESGVNELPDKPVDKLQWKCDNIKSLYREFYRPNINVPALTDEHAINQMKNLDTSKVITMEGMFESYNSSVSNKFEDLSIITIDAQSCIDMGNMFKYSNYLTNPPNIINTKNVKYMQNMFYYCSKLVEVPNLDTSNATNMAEMFNNCKLESIPRLDTGKSTSLVRLFCYCEKLKEVPPGIDTSNATNIAAMFQSCKSLTTFPYSKLNTSKVTNFGGLFGHCSNLLNVPEMDTSKASYVNGMYQGCEKLETIPTLNLIKAVSVQGMFDNCKKLTNLTLKNIKVSLQIGSGTSWGHLLTDESIINTFQELHDMTGTSAKTLTLSTPSYARAEAIYVKLIDITDEMRAEDEYIDNKKPCVVCKSTDEGAMTLKEYGISKNWNISK